MVVYFSGTGNSRYCAQMLATRLGDELVDAFPLIRGNLAAELDSQRPWVFVAPTYGWQLPRIFVDFLRNSCFTGCKSAYFVMTCGSEIGSAGAKIQPLCIEKGFVYQGVLEVRMPENYIALFEVPDGVKSAQIISAAEPVVMGGLDCIRRGIPFPDHKNGIVDRLKTSMINPLFYALCVKATPFYTTDACTGCGKCAQSCPLNNIRLEGKSPVWGNHCTHCMACISNCPTEAIEYGRHSRGKPRHRCSAYEER